MNGVVQGMVGTASVLEGVRQLLSMRLVKKQKKGEKNTGPEKTLRQLQRDFKEVCPLKKDSSKPEIIDTILTHQLGVYDGQRRFDLLKVDPTRRKPVIAEHRDVQGEVKQLQAQLETLKVQADTLQALNDSLSASNEQLSYATREAENRLSFLDADIQQGTLKLKAVKSELQQAYGAKGRKTQRRRSTGGLQSRKRSTLPKYECDTRSTPKRQAVIDKATEILDFLSPTMLNLPWETYEDEGGERMPGRKTIAMHLAAQRIAAGQQVTSSVKAASEVFGLSEASVWNAWIQWDPQTHWEPDGRCRAQSLMSSCGAGIGCMCACVVVGVDGLEWK